MITQVIESGKATLRELRENYSLRDLYILWEIEYNERYRKWMAYEDRRKSTDSRRR